MAVDEDSVHPMRHASSTLELASTEVLVDVEEVPSQVRGSYPEVHIWRRSHPLEPLEFGHHGLEIGQQGRGILLRA